jgi:hypothetical protein
MQRLNPDGEESYRGREAPYSVRSLPKSVENLSRKITRVFFFKILLIVNEEEYLHEN